jgi:Fe-S-cluster containining protein
MNLCLECSKLDKTCCQLGSGVVLLTDQDINRIELFVNENKDLQIKNFWLNEEPKEYLSNRIKSSFDPNMKKYALSLDGKVQTLKHKSNGDCIFLSDKGCVLPMETRPLYCRIHPYDFVEEEIVGITFVDCPVHLLKKRGDLPDEINVKYDDADRWTKMLYKELREGKIYKGNMKI